MSTPYDVLPFPVPHACICVPLGVRTHAPMHPCMPACTRACNHVPMHACMHPRTTATACAVHALLLARSNQLVGPGGQHGATPASLRARHGKFRCFLPSQCRGRCLEEQQEWAASARACAAGARGRCTACGVSGGVFCLSRTTSVLLKAAQKPIYALNNSGGADVVFTFRSFLGWEYPFGSSSFGNDANARALVRMAVGDQAMRSWKTRKQCPTRSCPGRWQCCFLGGYPSPSNMLRYHAFLFTRLSHVPSQSWYVNNAC